MVVSACAAHTLDKSKMREYAVVFFACVLTSAIRVNYRTAHFRVTFTCVFDSLNTQLRTHIIRHCNPQNRRVKAVINRRNVEFTVICGDFRYIRNALLTGLFS